MLLCIAHVLARKDRPPGLPHRLGYHLACRFFPTILIVLLAVFNDGAMIALSKDRVEASATPDQWNLAGIFTTGIVYGLYLTLSTWALYFTATHTQVPYVQALLPDVCSWRPQPTVRTVVHCGFGALPLSLCTFFNKPTSVRARLTTAAPAWCACATMRLKRWAVLHFQCGLGSLLTVSPAFQSCPTQQSAASCAACRASGAAWLQFFRDRCHTFSLNTRAKELNAYCYNFINSLGYSPTENICVVSSCTCMYTHCVRDFACLVRPKHTCRSCGPQTHAAHYDGSMSPPAPCSCDCCSRGDAQLQRPSWGCTATPSAAHSLNLNCPLLCRYLSIAARVPV